ncbi:MAG TPA: YciI family protein [Baekduia sp.]|nr:YciI family protein [Baekduia sp.]
MPHFFCRLNPPRPTFATDMTEAEQQLMAAHGEHWSRLLEDGRVVVFGVVGDPAGPWGVTIVEADDERAARAWTDADPVIARGDGFSYDVFPMPNAVTASR